MSERFEPVCRFGPGGDFMSFWPLLGSRQALRSGKTIDQVLGAISDIITASLGSEFEPYRVLHYGTRSRTNPAAAAEPVRKTTSRQPTLFADNSRSGPANEHNQKHHIRAHHRDAKRKAARIVHRQGRLFEIDFKGAKSA